ncbi:ATP-binding protein [Clostridia bacterium]|nr:ATP-binding protein [Clostridia bacterium]
MNKILAEVCKKLHFSSSLLAKAKRIEEKPNLEFLLELFTAEIEERERKRRNANIKYARIDIIKTFENYTFDDIKLPNSISVDEIKNADFITKRENLIMYGNVGAGKTHLAIATGIAACNAGFRTSFWRTASLVNALTEAKREGRLSKFMKQFYKLDLLICDEWGYVPIDSDGSKLLFTVVSECYERKSLIITTNLEFAKWNEIFADAKITAALLDRMIHHSHLLDFTSRSSRRLRDALQSKNRSDDAL